MSASIGMIGGARAQYHLRQSFVYLNMHLVNKPEVIVTYAPDKIDENGRLRDENTRKLIRQLIESLIGWTLTLKSK